LGKIYLNELRGFKPGFMVENNFKYEIKLLEVLPKQTSVILVQNFSIIN
jgi:hypothetical protein